MFARRYYDSLRSFNASEKYAAVNCGEPIMNMSAKMQFLRISILGYESCVYIL
jgi:hypothetical protein